MIFWRRLGDAGVELMYSRDSVRTDGMYVSVHRIHLPLPIVLSSPPRARRRPQLPTLHPKASQLATIKIFSTPNPRNLAPKAPPSIYNRALSRKGGGGGNHVPRPPFKRLLAPPKCFRRPPRPHLDSLHEPTSQPPPFPPTLRLRFGRHNRRSHPSTPFIPLSNPKPHASYLFFFFGSHPHSLNNTRKRRHAPIMGRAEIFPQ